MAKKGASKRVGPAMRRAAAAPLPGDDGPGAVVKKAGPKPKPMGATRAAELLAQVNALTLTDDERDELVHELSQLDEEQFAASPIRDMLSIGSTKGVIETLGPESRAGHLLARRKK